MIQFVRSWWAARRLGGLRSLVLAALEEGSAYGVELAQRIERRTEGKVRVDYALFAMYPVLWDLQEEGQVRSWEVGSPPLSPEDITIRAGRPRRYYELVPT